MTKSLAATLGCLLGLVFLSVAHADTPLDKSMKRFAKAYKQLSLDLKQPVDASKSDYVALANTLKTETQTARGLVPEKVGTLPADQQAAMVTAYQKSIDELGVTVDDLIKALQAGQWDVARQQMESLRKQEGEGHKEFRLDKKMQGNAPPPPPATSPPAPAAAQ